MPPDPSVEPKADCCIFQPHHLVVYMLKQFLYTLYSAEVCVLCVRNFTQSHALRVHHSSSLCPLPLLFLPSPWTLLIYLFYLYQSHLLSISAHLNERAAVILYFNQMHYTFSMIQCSQLQAFRADIKTHLMAAGAHVHFTLCLMYSCSLSPFPPLNYFSLPGGTTLTYYFSLGCKSFCQLKSFFIS